MPVETPGAGVVVDLPAGWSVTTQQASGLAMGLPRAPRSEFVVLDADLQLRGPPVGTATIQADGDSLLLVESAGGLSWVVPELDGNSARFTLSAPPPDAGGLAADVRMRAWVLRSPSQALVGVIGGVALTAFERRKRVGPVHITGDRPTNWHTTVDLKHLADRPPRSLLVLLHGTFSSTRGSYGGLAGPSIAALRRHYDLVVGFDHPTLSASPLTNAQALWETLADTGWAPPDVIDVVGFSRGGLVARSLIQQALAPAWRRHVRHLRLLASPDAGTALASQGRWLDLANLITNLSAGAAGLAALHPATSAGASVLDQLVSGVAALVRGLAGGLLSRVDVPGLAAMDPGSALLRTLHGGLPAHVDARALAADFDASGPGSAVLERTADAWHGDANDLVVPLSGVGAIGTTCNIEVHPESGRHHLDLVGGAGAWLTDTLGVGDPGVGSGVASSGLTRDSGQDRGPAARASARQAARFILQTHRHGLSERALAELHGLEDQHPGVLLDLASTGPRRTSAEAPPFSSIAEHQRLQHTVAERWSSAPPLAPARIGEVLDASRSPLRPVGSGRALSDASAPGRGPLLGTAHLADRWLAPPPRLAVVNDQDLYWCGAGRTLRGIVQDLAADRPPRALSNLCASDFQTIAGALSTGTHGSGAGLPAMHAQVASLVIVGVDDGGQPCVMVVERASEPVTDPAAFDRWAQGWQARHDLPGPPRLTQDDHRFRAHVLALGCMGVIVGVALRVVPQYFLAETRTDTTWEAVRSSVVNRARAARHFELHIDPWPQSDGRHACLVVRRTLSAPDQADAHGEPTPGAVDGPLARAVAGALLERAIARPLERLPEQSARRIQGGVVAHRIDRSDLVLRGDPDLWPLAGEYAVDIEDTVPAVDRLLELLGQHIAQAQAFAAARSGDAQGLWLTTPVPAGPLVLRFVAADDALLSCQQGRDSATLDLCFPGSAELDACLKQDPDDDGPRMACYRAYDTGRRVLLEQVELDLIGRFAARPHWGMHSVTDGSTLAALFPAFSDWKQHYDRANASGGFNGPLTARLGIDR